MLALSRRALLRVYRPSWVVCHGVPSISNQSVSLLQILASRTDDLSGREGALWSSTTCRLYYCNRATRMMSDCQSRLRSPALLTMSTVVSVRRTVGRGALAR